MNDETVLVSDAESVRTITINRPFRRNALDPHTACRLRDILTETRERKEIRVVVLTGAGGAFCSGADLRDGMAAGEKDLLGLAFNPVIRLIRELPKPVIAAVDGPATGYGCSLALACDIRLASERARFSLIFVKVGLMVDGGASYLLPRLIGLRALEYALTGDFIEARQAEAMGLVNHTYPAEELLQRAGDLAKRLAQQAPLALAATKAAVHFAERSDLDAALEWERRGQLELLGTEDVREGILAFLEKRAPVYQGR